MNKTPAFVREWYAYESEFAMYKDLDAEDLDDAMRIAKDIVNRNKEHGLKYRVEVIAPTARISFKSEED